MPRRVRASLQGLEIGEKLLSKYEETHHFFMLKKKFKCSKFIFNFFLPFHTFLIASLWVFDMPPCVMCHRSRKIWESPKISLLSYFFPCIFHIDKLRKFSMYCQMLWLGQTYIISLIYFEKVTYGKYRINCKWADDFV